MKKFILLGILLLSGTIGFAQCDQDVVLTSSKTEYLDSLGNLQRTEDEESVIKIGKSRIVIKPGQGEVMNGTIESVTCDWKVPYKEGKSVIKAVFEGPMGNLHSTITMDGSPGKLTFLMEIAEIRDKKIRVSPVTFKEAAKE